MVQQSTNNIFENVYKFNGKELDESTGYYYYGARYYDPGASVFLSVDPLAEQFPGWNPYHYVHNNPINLIDPTGMCAENYDPPAEGNFANGTVHTDKTGSWTYNDGIWGDNSGGGNDFLGGISIDATDGNSNLANVITAGQLGGGAAAGILGELSSKYMEQSFYNMGDASNASNSLRMNNSNYQGPGVGTYASGYQESMKSIRNLNTGLNVMSKALNYAGYIDGGLKISKGEFTDGVHALGNNYLGIRLGATLGWGYGLIYTGAYTIFENTLPKSEFYNKTLFGVNSPTYKSRIHFWTESKLLP